MGASYIASVKLTDIDPKPEFQPRVKLDQETISEYARQMEDGVEFPPITVFKNEKGGYVLAAGYHRYEAHKILDKEDIAVEVHESSSDIDILKFAIESNAGHGKPFSNADKRKAVTLVLKKAPDWSDWHIARLCKVSNHLVKDVKESLNIKPARAVNVVRNGTEYSMESKNIGPDRSPPVLAKLLESKVNNLIKTLDTFMLAHQAPDVKVPPDFDSKIREFINWYSAKNGGFL
jgi:hypothetical protein